MMWLDTERLSQRYTHVDNFLEESYVVPWPQVLGCMYEWVDVTADMKCYESEFPYTN